MGCTITKEVIANKRTENTMVIGNTTFSEESTLIDDQEELKKRGNFIKISAIRVSHSKQAVDSIQFAYELDCGTIVSGGNHVKSMPTKKESNSCCNSANKEEKSTIAAAPVSTVPSLKKRSASYSDSKESDSPLSESVKNEVFEILEDDFLQEISGRIGEQIEQITFKTYRGYSATFANGKKGNPFYVHLSNETFGPLTSNQHLNALRFPIIPVPETFQTDFHRKQHPAALVRNLTH